MHSPPLPLSGLTTASTSRKLAALVAAALVGICVSEAAPALKVAEGFEIIRVAGLDLVQRPICADFDDKGRLYVAESSGSNDKVEIQLEKRPHRILRLEDVDGDGVFDRRTVFADRMMLPQGILWHDGAVYCGAPPSIWKLQDTDGDGVADKRSEWWKGETLTGCANDIHGPYLGPDGYFYWCKGAFAKQEHDLPGGRKLADSAAHIYRSRPDGSGFDSFISGGMDNPVEIAWDAAGNLFFTTTFFNHPRGGKRDAIVHGIYGAVYPKRHGVIDGLVRTGDLMPAMTHLWPAAPCGLLCYKGDRFRGDLFCCQFNTHKVSRHVLQPSGSTFTTTDSDFVTSDSPDFHPTDVLEDRDGSLLVIDTGGWYKLCCPTSQMAKPQVPGAIYRVRQVGNHQPLVGKNTPELAAQTRLREATSIAQRRDKSAVPRLLAEAGDHVDRTLEHAIIYALIMIADPRATAEGLASANPHTRRAAMIALDQIEGGGVAAGALRTAIESDEPVVRDAAWWIYEAHPERGAELVDFFTAHPEQLARHGKLSQHAALRPVFHAWLGAALASREEPRIAEVLPVLRGFDEGSRAKFQEDLATISRDETIAIGYRLDAIELLAAPVPADLFLFLHGQDDSRAAAQLARARLHADQKRTLISSLATATALQLPYLLQCFRDDSDGELGRQLLGALRKSKGLASLRIEELDRAMGNFSDELRSAARSVLSEKKQQLADPARLERIANQLPAGDAARGHLVFNSAKAACFSCHAIGYRGGDFGPGLSRIGSIRSGRDLLEAIVFPSASIVRSYEPVIIKSQSGSAIGIISDRTDEAISVRIAPGLPAIAFPAESIVSIAPAETSMMPAGLDEQLTRQELADLIAFLESMR